VTDCPVAADPGRDPAPATILVVEDEVLIRLMLAEELRDAGFCVLEAADADEAMAVLHAAPHVALLFTDVRMPGSLDGLGLVRWVRARWRHIKVIVASADEAGLDTPAAFDAILRKPYDVAAMIDCVRRLVAGTDAR
jgi:CheY-like chemotaxis protein